MKLFVLLVARFAFDRPMFANCVGSACSPNVAYAGAALLAGLLAVGSVAVRHRTGERRNSLVAVDTEPSKFD